MAEWIKDSVSDEEVTRESNLRASKMGYCTKDGLPEGRTKIMSMPPSKKYEENYKKIFGHD
jgi:hypothetical protein